MSASAILKILALQESEIRTAGLALAAFEAALDNAADEDMQRRLLAEAFHACRIALHGITETSTLMLLNVRDLRQEAKP